eukprot:scaffold1787_cov75-Skeletonema_dohrnii-CCMP3373.AAC.2
MVAICNAVCRSTSVGKSVAAYLAPAASVIPIISSFRFSCDTSSAEQQYIETFSEYQIPARPRSMYPARLQPHLQMY